MKAKLLVVNADDFGFTRDVNEGIVAAHTQGILTAATLMANGDAFDHAVDLAHQTPSLDIGVHLVLVGGKSPLRPHRPYPADVPRLVRALWTKQIDIERELDAQIRRIREAAVPLSHLDTHKHTHLLPPVLDCVARLSRRYGIPFVRRPFDYPMQASPVPLARRVVSRGLGFVRSRFHRVLRQQGCKTTDYFAGFSLTGYLHTREMLDVLRQIPPGCTEFMTHPGYCREELRAAATRLKAAREKELEALTAPETRQAIRDNGIRLVNYREL